MLAVLLPALVGLVVSLVSERLVRPRVKGLLQRPAASVMLHLGLWSVCFAVFVLALQRPWLVVVLLVALELVVILASNAKWDSLREPFLIDDFEYFIDAVRYPRLYVPFFGIARAVTAFAAVTAAVCAFLVLEPAIFAGTDAARAAITLTALAIVGLALIHVGRKRLPRPSLEPCEDLASLGVVGHFWAYGQEQRPALPSGGTSPLSFNPPTPEGNAPLADVVVVQNESFFDARRWSTVVNPGLLPHWDAVVAKAEAYGRLQVPAWGANTARTEAAVLTGLGPQALGVDQFNPYRRLARQPVPNLAGTLRELGYETVVIHPYPAGFYARDRVMQTMGFDRFLDIEAFSEAERDGQFISDRAVAQRLQEVLGEPRNHPLFVFVITMENHGPTHLERADLTDEALRSTLADPDNLPKGCGDLAVYLRHLANADRMLGECCAALEAAERPGVLAWYGDHVPILPSVYRWLGAPDGRTHYAIWTTSAKGGPHERPLSAQELGPAVLDRVLEVAPSPKETEKQAGGRDATTDSVEHA